MVLSVPPPPTVLVIGVAIFAVVVATGRRGTGNRRVQLIRIAVAAVIIGGLLFFIYRPSTISVTAAGIDSTNRGKVSIPWTTVTEAIYVPNMTSSEYRTTSKIKGIAVGSYRIGDFKTAGAGQAHIIAQQQKSALVIKAGGSLYEFAPEKLDLMAAAVAKYVPLSGWPPKD